MATVKLTKVNIGPNKTYSTFNIDGELVTQEVMVVPLDEELNSTFVGSVTKISFVTPSGKLEDNQYATQPNGFHWVKLPSYEMYKIDPGFISKNILSQAGIDFIYTNSVLE
jgi:hypothetical protein